MIDCSQHIFPQNTHRNRVDQRRRLRTGKHHTFLSENPSDDNRVAVARPHQLVFTVFQIPQVTGILLITSQSGSWEVGTLQMLRLF